jgi:hypothetical protein
MTLFEELVRMKLPLYFENEAFSRLGNQDKAGLKILEYVIPKHKAVPYGIIPKRIDVWKQTKLSPSNLSATQGRLIEKGLLVTVSLEELKNKYCTWTQGWKIPAELWPSIGADLERYGPGHNTGIIYYVARVKDSDGIPLFNTILPNLVNAATISEA